ncbi:cupin domain-containing protein [Chachezhania antarctica]|uniref:cupin domain-containing protein n=1 Tax=Chachezhania antarctica TaxID=2340860 RepID=UPI000EB0FC8B|nr:cupin domain-containing protein [Chachezhania antarctica]|tara:strand:+ start:2133 stop:2603 length:471 start_codon:yes stop_codon:yes gene_type:complete
MGKVDLGEIEARTGSRYPARYAAAVAERSVLGVGAAGGITQFGANIVTVPAGTQSSLRHWHMRQDEFLIVLTGQMVLIMDDGETPMGPGDCAAFPAGVEDGHCLINRSDSEATFFVVGTNTATETVQYSDIDMMVADVDGKGRFTRKDGSPIEDPA